MRLVPSIITCTLLASPLIRERNHARPATASVQLALREAYDAADKGDAANATAAAAAAAAATVSNSSSMYIPSALDLVAPSQYGRGGPQPENLTGGSFLWDEMDAFQGQKVMEAKMKLTKPQRPLPERMRSVWSNLSEQGPAQVLLVAFFIFITVFDILYAQGCT